MNIPRTRTRTKGNDDAYQRLFAGDRLAWFAANPYNYREIADKCSEAAAFLAAKG